MISHHDHLQHECQMPEFRHLIAPKQKQLLFKEGKLFLSFVPVLKVESIDHYHHCTITRVVNVSK